VDDAPKDGTRAFHVSSARQGDPIFQLGSDSVLSASVKAITTLH
jgi:hypothetical protein